MKNLENTTEALEYLYISFKDIYMAWYANKQLLNEIFEFWHGSLDTVEFKKDSVDDRTWKVYVEKVPSGQESSQLEIKSKTIIHKHSYEYELIEANSLIRELLVKLTLTRGITWLHASAFTIKEKNIMVIGPKGTGKTTWLLTALLKMHGVFIGNDQVPVEIKDGDIYIQRWRPDIKVRIETLELLEENCTKALSRSNYADRFLWVAKNNYNNIDTLIKAMSHRRKENIKAFPINKFVKIDEDKVKKVDAIIYMDELAPIDVIRISQNQVRCLWKKIIQDTEVIFPRHINNWNSRIDYWNNRVDGLISTDKATLLGDLCLEKIIQDVPSYYVNNRSGIKNIIKNLNNIVG